MDQEPQHHLGAFQVYTVLGPILGLHILNLYFRKYAFYQSTQVICMFKYAKHCPTGDVDTYHLSPFSAYIPK